MKDDRRTPLPPAMQLECEEILKALQPEVEKCARCGQYVIALVRCDDGELHLEARTVEFPVDQFERAVELLRDGLSKDKTRLVGGGDR